MKCAKSALLAAFASAATLPSAVHAQSIGPDAFGYTANGLVNYVFDDISLAGVTPGTAILNNATAATPAVQVALGFNFDFYGQTYSSVYIKSDGVISFGQALPHPDDGTARDMTELFSNNPGDFDHPAIAVMWDTGWRTTDANADAVYYLTEGVTGNRRFIVQWNDLVHFFADDATGTTATFQVVLREGSNTFELRYFDTVVDGSFSPLVDNGQFASVGIRNTGAPSNAEFLQWSSRQNQANVTSGLAIEFIPPTGPATPEEAIDDLVDYVINLNLHNGIENSLDSKLDSALDALTDANDNNDGAAVNKLQAFINHVEAQRGNKISDSQADGLIAHAQAIIDLILNP